MPSVDLNIRQNDNTNIVRLLTTTGGTSGLQLYDNFYHTDLKTVDLNSSDQNAYQQLVLVVLIYLLLIETM